MSPDADSIADRPSLLRSRRAWSILVAIVLLGGGIAGAIWTTRIIANGRRFEALSEQYLAWEHALRVYDPFEPIKKRYVVQLATYYRQLGRKYALAHWQPWREAGPDLVPPARPAELPGTVDPTTGIPPEVTEAIANLGGPPSGP